MALASLPGFVRAETFPLGRLDLHNFEHDYGEARRDKSVEGNPLSIGGVKFAHGVGTHATSTVSIALNGNGDHFSASVGVDDDTQGKGSISFQVVGDGKVLLETPVLHSGEAAKEVSVDLSGINTLVLNVGDGGDGIDYDHADWANAQIVMKSGAPKTIRPPVEVGEVLTPPSPATPAIHGAKIFGVRPGSPFLFTVAATGDLPISYSARHLPRGLRLDSATGRITGSLDKPGTYLVTLRVKNSQGSASRPFKIVCGDTLALTPPLGWNSWNCFASAVSDGDVRAAADAMVSSGLIRHGWTYINIDDTWEADRDSEGKILSNKKFPDMKALADYVHAKGLKIGIYSSPGPKTCAGYTASYQHEGDDARRYAEWGFDYLKYDWCSYGHIAPHPDHDELMKPYQLMHGELVKVQRDIVFSLCQYGMGNVWEWGAQVGGNCWRTTGDIVDTWGSMSANGFHSAGIEKYAGPGHWNDPDMLVVGQVGWSANVRPTRLTPNEQYTHISLWCLLDSPLLIGCDMTKLDPFTLNLLTNDEVLDVNQDPLGQQASRVVQNGFLEIWAKDLEDGSKVVGLFNRGPSDADVTVKWSDLGISGSRMVRDLWRQKDLGKSDGEFTSHVTRHGVTLIKVSGSKRTD